jgi:superfamily I DNA/RNA helicase
VGQKRAYEAEANTNRSPRVKFATVHAAQGTEHDVVILDLVLAPGRGKSRFMDEKRTPEFTNLMNVGLSRARKELIIVSHREYVAGAYPDGLLDRLQRQVQADGHYIRIPRSLRCGELFSTAWQADT